MSSLEAIAHLSLHFPRNIFLFSLSMCTRGMPFGVPRRPVSKPMSPLSSDKAIGALLKSLRKTLFPHSQSVDEETGQLSPSNKISNSVLQDAVMSVATRTNYGIDNGPASLCIWRWEANDLAVVQNALGDMESAATRKVQRVKARPILTYQSSVGLKFDFRPNRNCTRSLMLSLRKSASHS